MKQLQRFDAFLNKLEGGLLVFFLAVMLVLAFLQVMLRNLFSFGFLWADLLLRHLVLWTGFLGAALATSQGRHISIDAFTRFLPERVKHATSILTNLFATTVCYFLLTASLAFLKSEMQSGSLVYGNIPVWWGEAMIPVGFTLLAVHFLVRAVLDLHATIAGGTV